MASGSVPLVVLATLHRHYGAMLRLDGSDATSPSEAAELLGARSEFVARKALEQSRRLGSEQDRPGDHAASPRRTSTCGAGRVSPMPSCSRSWWPGSADCPTG